MGSIEPISTPLAGRELRVLVTGFGPFREQYPVNPSWEIASRLPDYLPAERAKDPVARQQQQQSAPPPLLPAVRILQLPEAIRVSYEVVRGLMPELWDADDGSSTAIDYAVHVGMAGPRPGHYALERRGHRDGYAKRDVDGRPLDDEARHRDQGAGWVWHGLPRELETDLDAEDVHRRWVARSPKDLSLQVSDDAGHYLCDFIYYSSLAHLHKQRRRRNVVFLHVPLHSDEHSLALGRELVLNLIRSIVESELAREATASASTLNTTT
ncbi:putative pyroglutamyl peptidase type I [Xylariaceae sp. FL0804]|nr:putative pyroglutamyl peptidase type I [Xylariaceae sp. FL0804]